MISIKKIWIQRHDESLASYNEMSSCVVDVCELALTNGPAKATCNVTPLRRKTRLKPKQVLRCYLRAII